MVADSRARPNQVISQSLINLSLAFWAIIVILPLVWLLYSSFKTDQEIFFEPWALPETPQWENFERAWVAVDIGQYFLNSMRVVIPSLVLTLALSSMTSYVLARFQFVGVGVQVLDRPLAQRSLAAQRCDEVSVSI